MNSGLNLGLTLFSARTLAHCFFFQPGQFFFGFRGYALADKIAKREDQWVGNRVNAAGSLLPTSNQSALKQQIQVLGDVRLVRVKILDQLGNGLLRLGKRLKDPEPKRFSKGAESPRNHFQRASRQRYLTHVSSVSLHAHIVLTQTDQV